MNESNQDMAFGSCPELDKPFTDNSMQDLELHDGSEQYDLEIDDNSTSIKDVNDKEDEPLFVVDKTDSFKMRHAIQYESQKNSYEKNQRIDTGSKQNSCWNCGMPNHSLHNCPEPRNQPLININRHMFLMQKHSQPNNFHEKGFKNRGRKNVRYFVAGNKSPYNNLTPGKISAELLKALGLPENGIPVHVYRMRKYGYPRAWLEEARDEYSGISIFTAPNKCLPFPGKKKDATDAVFCNINKRKLHEYPGFNAPPPANSIDECKKYECPEFNPEQSLNHMYENLQKNITDTKTELHGDSYNEDTGFLSNETLPGEESFQSKSIESKKSTDHMPSSPEDGEITDEDISLEDNCVESPSNGTASEKINDDQSNSDTFESGVDTKDYVNDTQISLSNSLNSENESISLNSSVKRKFGDVKSELLGTPVLKHVSTYSNRPTHENFAKGMVDLVEHENLPNATGTFKKIKEILKDVRQTLNNLL